jgi:hypothetical protein
MRAVCSRWSNPSPPTLAAYRSVVGVAGTAARGRARAGAASTDSPAPPLASGSTPAWKTGRARLWFRLGAKKPSSFSFAVASDGIMKTNVGVKQDQCQVLNGLSCDLQPPRERVSLLICSSVRMTGAGD